MFPPVDTSSDASLALWTTQIPSSLDDDGGGGAGVKAKSTSAAKTLTTAGGGGGAAVAEELAGRLFCAVCGDRGSKLGEDDALNGIDRVVPDLDIWKDFADPTQDAGGEAGGAEDAASTGVVRTEAQWFELETERLEEAVRTPRPQQLVRCIQCDLRVRDDREREEDPRRTRRGEAERGGDQTRG